MLIQWSQDLSVENPEIDAQHQKLIEKINQLHEAASKGEAGSLIIEMVEFLEKYAKEHFRYEESYFSAKAFPETVTHCAIHKKFIEEVAKAREKLNQDGVTPTLVIQVSQFAADWIFSHIKKVDHRYCEFIRTGVCPQ